MGRFNLSFISIPALALSAVVAFMSATVRGDIFISNYYEGTIGEYTNSGATVNASR